MHPDEYGDNPFLEDEETDLAYDDGFGEADQISSNKRHEKTRREALRKDTGKIVSSTRRIGGRHLEQTALKQRARNEAIRQGRIRWERQFRMLIIRHWSPGFGPLDAVLLALMKKAMIRRLIAIIEEKFRDPTISGVEDVILIPSRALLASAVAQAARHTGKITPKQQEALTRILDNGLDLAEKIIKIYIGSGGAGETEGREAMPDLTDDLEAIASADEDDFSWEDFPDGERVRDGRHAARVPPKASSPNDRRLAAQVLRESAKYLLRMERRLLEAGR